ncbi:signal peptidase I [Arthrobacter silviterrae]|uniref:Signal peptidase I n=1 Tax=Arthrobacter silviterrae TaxID=2026658 RepID=A0ABX0D844_9MICC|nr:signal peptidase I [Arthrobacter silviterrae]MDQ0276795.1 signal peptidase I [Arthrobacter silviterrae]NGN83068.1 signal peptidase I [Arthrobacter silviterrae]
MQQNAPGDPGPGNPGQDDGGNPDGGQPEGGQPETASTPGARVPEGETTALERVSNTVWAWSKEIVTILAIAIVLSFLIKTFLFRAFYIPSGSMENTLEINDRIFVNLLVPQPFALKRGDVVVFKDTQGWLANVPKSTGPFAWVGDIATFIGLAPDSSQQHLVKRVIGLPGDRVKCCDADGKMTINGKAITEPYLFPGASPSDTTFDVTVPAGHLWVMGDHRNDSEDSRAHQAANGTGFVPIADVEGRAVVIAWPLDRLGILGNYPNVFADVPAPASAASQGSPSAIPAGQ